MQESNGLIWIASWPRSGNTLLRQILWQNFGLRSASIYPNDLGGDAELEARCGHVEHQGHTIVMPDQVWTPLKTHGFPSDSQPVIYVVRDGRDACVSLWDFYGRQLSLEDVIAGRHRFGTWADHLLAWKPWERPRTAFIRYEDLIASPADEITRMAHLMNIEPRSLALPERKSDGQWVNPSGQARREVMTENQKALFWDVNAAVMERLGYERVEATA